MMLVCLSLCFPFSSVLLSLPISPLLPHSPASFSLPFLLAHLSSPFPLNINFDTALAALLMTFCQLKQEGISSKNSGRGKGREERKEKRGKITKQKKRGKKGRKKGGEREERGGGGQNLISYCRHRWNCTTDRPRSAGYKARGKFSHFFFCYYYFPFLCLLFFS